MKRTMSGWPIVELGDVANISSGYGFPVKLQGRLDEEIPFYKVGNISKAFRLRSPYLERADHYVGKSDLTKLKAKLIPKGAIVFAKIGEALKLNRRAILSQDSLVDNNVMAVVPNDNLDNKFVYYFFMTQDLALLSAGNSVPSVRKSSIEKIAIPLPPLPEQKLIVAKLDTLFAHLDQLRARLDKIPVLLKQFRQAVLTLAVTGKLTEEWRGVNTIQESGKQLLERIEREIRATHEKEVTSSQQKGLSKPRLSRGYKTHLKYEIETPSHNLPNSWARTVVDRIGNVFVGSTPSRGVASYWNGDIPWVSSGEVANNRIRRTNEKITAEGLAGSSAKLLPKGAVLIAMIGEGKTRGQSGILELDACTNQNVAAIVSRPSHFVPEYLWYYLLSTYNENREQGRGGNQPALNGQKVGAININVPPILEQREIIRRIESLFSLSNKIEAVHQTLKKGIDQIPSVLLSKAFRDELINGQIEMKMER